MVSKSSKMSEALSIKRRKSTESDVSFDSLKRDAIQLIEQISGQVWTDYNLHDPGITIIEQLIYAMTDIIYRTEFAVEDYLASEEGQIDFNFHALYAPEDAFPCRPTTINDYRKVFINEVKEIENVWLVPISEQISEVHHDGLYRVLLKLEPGLDIHSHQAILSKLQKIYNTSRNLCEDITEIIILENIEYELCANIEVSGAKHPEDILAEIYYSCLHLIGDSISVIDFDQQRENVASLDELFTGPYTNHGSVLSDNKNKNLSEFLVSSLFTAINSIEGIDHIQQLYLQKDGESFYDIIVSDDTNKAFGLLIPQTAEEINVVLTTNGRVLPLNIDSLHSKLDEIKFKYHSSRSTPQDLTQLYKMPQGVARPLKHYSGIQDQFPINYGINAFGVPESAPTDVKARANQLKSYLVIFEQLLANFLANLDSIKNLFSIEGNKKSSYSFQLIDQQAVSSIDSIYPNDPVNSFKRIIAGFDNYYDRKSRLLDYMLALYGESFSQNSLRHFNYYYSKDEIEETIVNNKIAYLKSVIDLGRNRAAAADYSSSSWSRCAHSGLQARVSMLLGFEECTARPLTMEILEQGIKLTQHKKYEFLKAGSHELKFIDIGEADEFSCESFEEAPACTLAKDISLNEIRQAIGEAIPLKNNLLSDILLRDGIYINRYKIGSLTSRQGYQLTFQTEDNQYWYLGTYDDKSSAIYAANCMRHFLIRLNKGSEGLQVIEHILLRPSGQQTYNGLKFNKDEDFFSCRISVIFPGWTTRCYNTQFRMLAEETVRLNTPAHIYPDFYWLDFMEMYKLESLYAGWMRLKRKQEPDNYKLNDCARKLITFLLNSQKPQKNRI